MSVRGAVHRPRQPVRGSRRARRSSIADAIDRVNAIDETITVATLPAYRAVEDGDMVATVKIIPFSTREATLEAALEALGVERRCPSRRSGRCGSPSSRPCFRV